MSADRMTAPTEAERIARTLTEAQRAKVLSLSSSWLNDADKTLAWLPVAILEVVSRTSQDFQRIRLTPLGLAVRQVLERGE